MAKDVVQESTTASAEPVDFFGEFRFKVDAKGRVALPAEFRKALSGDLVETLELTDKCLYVFETPAFNEWVKQLFVDKFGGYKASNPKHVAYRTKLRGRGRRVEVDSSGRIILRPEMREAAGIKKDVVLVGNTGYFEIWDADAYDRRMESVDLSDFYSDDDEEAAPIDKSEMPLSFV